MNKLYTLLLLLSAGSLQSCDYCMYTETKNAESGTVQGHAPKQGDCNCSCTARRYNNGECSECGHKVTEVYVTIDEQENTY